MRREVRWTSALKKAANSLSEATIRLGHAYAYRLLDKADIGSVMGNCRSLPYAVSATASGSRVPSPSHTRARRASKLAKVVRRLPGTDRSLSMANYLGSRRFVA